MSAPFLQAVDLACERNDRLLFENLDITIVPGSLTRVEGPNGAGKTTLLRILAGLNTNYEGKLLWCGEPLGSNREYLARNLLYIGHRNGIKPALTPFENLRLQMMAKHGFTDVKLESALAAVNLQDFAHTPCHSLSEGQRRRVALSRLHLSDESVWILDEVFTAIDHDGVGALEHLLQARADAGGAIVMTTHHPLVNRQVATISLDSAALETGGGQMDRPQSIYL